MRYVVNRLIQLLIVIFAVTFLTSVALRFLPGGSDVVVALKTVRVQRRSKRRR